MDAYFNENAVLPQLVNAGTKKLDETADRIKEFLAKSRKFPVATTVFTRMVERSDMMSENYRYKMAEVDDTPPLVEKDGPGWDYYKVKPQPGDHEVTKTTYSAFKRTGLKEYLESKGVKTVILVGGYASRCVAATAFEAADEGFHVVIPEDLVANLDDPDVKDQESGWVDEKQAFLQANRAILGYSPSSSVILNTWEGSQQSELLQ